MKLATSGPRAVPSPLFALAAVLVSGCAVMAQPVAAPGGQEPAPAAPAATPTSGVAPAPAAPVPPSPLKPFADVIKGAMQSTGHFTLYEKDDKVWIELKPEQLDAPFFLSWSITHGVGERGIYGGRMGPGSLVVFHRAGNQMQLIAKNTDFVARPELAVARAVREGFSDSLVASAPVLSQPHPERKSVLIEANALLLADIPMAATQLETAFRLPYSFELRNSSFTKVRTADGLTTFNVTAHYFVLKLPAPPLVPSPTTPKVNPPDNLPDPRSLFLGFHYSLASLPEAMRGRVADERVGYFSHMATDYSDDLNPNPRVHLVKRWRLEKKDPDAALSEPRQPIVFWLDRNIPEKYRQTVIDGVLEWNKAFEKVGFKDAIRAEQQPADADWDTADVRHASIRWYLGSDVMTAVGPSVSDPRTGEILDADIRLTDIFTRASRRVAVEEVPRGAFAHGDEFCSYAAHLADEMDFAVDLLAARGDLAPDSPEAERFVQDYLKLVVMHEVGHTLGLRHNFRASTIFSEVQLSDPEFTGKHGLTGSIMDYTPYNLATRGERQGQYTMTTLGPYDYWAIEYGYKPVAPEQEKDELARVAARGSEPWLAYGTDEDSFIGGAPQGMDPEVNTFDLGPDPLAFYTKRLALSRELWDRLQARELKPGESYEVLRRNLEAGFRSLSRGLAPATKYIGGVVQVRDRAGSGRAPYTPVPAQRQREALKILADGMFSVDSFRFKPEFLSRITYNRLDFHDRLVRGQANMTPDFNLQAQVLDLQRSVLDQVMSDAVAARLLDSELKVADAKKAFHLSELYSTLQASIWSELKSGREITPMRRSLQREHLRRIAGTLVAAPASTPADARALKREAARELLAEIRAAQGKPEFSRETRAHLAESANTLEEALRAPIMRVGA